MKKNVMFDEIMQAMMDDESWEVPAEERPIYLHELEWFLLIV